MRKKNRGSRLWRLLLIFICVAFVFAVVWGIVTALAKLSHYGESTTIRSETEEPEEEETVVAPEEDPLPYNNYEENGFSEVNGIRTYSADGVQYSASRILNWQHNPPLAGQKFRLFYDPADPKKFAFPVF